MKKEKQVEAGVQWCSGSCMYRAGVGFRMFLSHLEFADYIGKGSWLFHSALAQHRLC